MLDFEEFVDNDDLVFEEEESESCSDKEWRPARPNASGTKGKRSSEANITPVESLASPIRSLNRELVPKPKTKELGSEFRNWSALLFVPTSNIHFRLSYILSYNANNQVRIWKNHNNAPILDLLFCTDTKVFTPIIGHEKRQAVELPEFFLKIGNGCVKRRGDRVSNGGGEDTEKGEFSLGNTMLGMVLLF